jgi:hypothetical protein
VVQRAKSGDTFVLADGTFTPDWGDGENALVVKTSIVIRALNPGGAVLDGRGILRLVKVEANASLALEGVVMTRGSAAVGPGPYGPAAVRFRLEHVHVYSCTDVPMVRSWSRARTV